MKLKLTLKPEGRILSVCAVASQCLVVVACLTRESGILGGGRYVWFGYYYLFGLGHLRSVSVSLDRKTQYNNNDKRDRLAFVRTGSRH